MTTPYLRFDFAEEGECLCFTEPMRVLEAATLEQVRPVLRMAQEAADQGAYVAGYVAYEAAPAFDSAFEVRPAGKLSLAWFGVFSAPVPPKSDPAGAFHLSDWTPGIPQSIYTDAIAQIREGIAEGDFYQANYTFPLRADFSGEAEAFYAHLRSAQPNSFATYLDLGDHVILSASPELFFRRTGTRLTTRPMKGTRPRGRWPEEDAGLAAELATSEKDRAENLMIVDLLRNDVGRIATIGSVRVESLFAMEWYPTVWQLTSTISAELPVQLSLDDIFAALFPCGSITGAPKIAAMHRLSTLETSPRQVYCGALGYLRPGGDAVFNVAIRTALLDRSTGRLEYGTGGGVTWDSDAADEYAEALVKARLVTESVSDFSLVETFRLTDNVFWLGERHLARLQSSADYFDFPFSSARFRETLAAVRLNQPGEALRVRLLLSRDGQMQTEAFPLVSLPETPQPFVFTASSEVSQPVALAAYPVDSRDRFLYHKTTYRAVYEAHGTADPAKYDVLLWNERGELTEFTRGNLAVRIDGVLWTPPVSCGLLAGTLRAELLDSGELRERVLLLPDLRNAEEVWFLNSVRGAVRVTLVDTAIPKN